MMKPIIEDSPQQATGLPKAIARFTAMHALAKSVQKQKDGLARYDYNIRHDTLTYSADIHVMPKRDKNLYTMYYWEYLRDPVLLYFGKY